MPLFVMTLTTPPPFRPNSTDAPFVMTLISLIDSSDIASGARPSAAPTVPPKNGLLKSVPSTVTFVLRPRWPEALYYLGRAYVQQKDLQNAQQAFAEAVKNSPNLIEAWIGLGITARDLGQEKEAIQALSRATQLDKNRADAWLNLGLAYEQSSELQLASDAYRQALNTATDPAIREQAEQGLDRAK